MDNSQSVEEDAITYKIIMIGDSTVGKTSLFRKLTKGKYSEKNISTVGIDRKSFPLKVKVNDNGEEIEKSFIIQLWDTAGQERFRAITKGYFKDSQGLLLIYDITNESSFANIDKWLLSIKDSLGKDENDNENINVNEDDQYLIFLLGNKVDLEKSGYRCIPTELGEKTSRKFNIIWGGECSAKEFTVEELKKKFEFFIQELYKKIGNSVPRNSIKMSKEDEETQNKKEEKKKCHC